MAKLSKRVKAFRERVDKDKHYSIEDAVGILTELSKVKFKESLDISVNLGVDPQKSDQVVRGSTVLPNGSGKKLASPERRSSLSVRKPICRIG